MNPVSSFRHRPPNQQGVALVVALVFLLILTILGVAAMGTASLEEKMAGNSKDRNLAFQAAESTLKMTENWINAQLAKPVFPDNTNGLYVSSSTATPVWESVSWTSSAGYVLYPSTPSQTNSGGLSKVNTQPKYIIEDLGEIPEQGGSLVLPGNYKGMGKTVLRITVRATGGTDAAVVMLQSTYARDF